MQSTGAGTRPSMILLVILALAFVIGAAASLVAGAAASPPFHSGTASEVIIPTWTLDVAFLIGFGFVLALFVWVRASVSSAVPGKLVVTMLAVLLVGILFVVILQAFGSGAGGFTWNTSGNGTAPSNPNGTITPGGNLSGPGGLLAPLHIPSWTLFVAVAVIALVVAAVAAPRAWRYLADRDPGRPKRPAPAELQEVRGALATAAQELGVGADPRTVIIALYATMLRRVGPIVGGVDTDTPEEIRALHLVRLGIRASAAETLTRLFEEARYSTRPMGPETAARAQEAIGEARADLDRLPLSP